ncbi:hypothetical protein Unana1_01827 [Umbelopsis nana]
MSSRIPCKFYQQGNCNKGNNCNFAHVKANNSARWGGTSSFGTNTTTDPPKYNETSLKTDLTTIEKAPWDLSVYGPAKEEPNLIVGTDRSFEEDRLKYYLSRIQTGSEAQYLQEREQALQIMNQQLNAIINDPIGAIRHFDNQKNKTTSAFGGVSAPTQFEPFRGNSGFGSSVAFGNNAFGNSGSAFGIGANTKATTSTFGGSTFGSSAFGGANNTNATPAFGSTGFQQTTSAFGNMSQPANNTFGNTSTGFGAATNQPAFGATSSMGGFSSASSFGSTSAFGAQAQPNGMHAGAITPAFGATSTPVQNSGFGMSRQGFGTAQPVGGFGSTPVAPATSGFSTGFGAQINQQQPPTAMSANDGAGSEQQAFLAPTFQYKMIPEQEPPIELR